MTKIKINSSKITEALEPLNAVVNPSHTIPILQSVKIDFNKKIMTATGDNLEVRCSNSVKIDTEDKLSICVNYVMLSTALKSVKNQEVLIQIDSTMLRIKHDKGEFKLPLEDSSTFPISKDTKLKLSAKLSSISLKNSLKVANKFVLNDDLAPMANISIQIGKKTIIRSTNQVSLFQETIKGGGDESDILISGKTSSAIQFLLEDDDDVELKYNESVIYFRFGNKEVTAIQQQGRFPLEMFKKIILSIDKAIALEINYSEFLTSLKRVSSLSMREKIQSVKLDFTKKELKLSCENVVSSSQVKESLNINFKEDKIIGFNGKLLIEILSVFDEKSSLSINEMNCLCINSKKKSGLIAPILLTA